MSGYAFHILHHAKHRHAAPCQPLQRLLTQQQARPRKKIVIHSAKVSNFEQIISLYQPFWFLVFCYYLIFRAVEHAVVPSNRGVVF